MKIRPAKNNYKTKSDTAVSHDGQHDFQESMETVSKIVTERDQIGPTNFESYIRVSEHPGYESDSLAGTSSMSINCVDDQKLLVRRPRKVEFGFGCILAFAVLCPILVITAGVIVRSACNPLRRSHLNRFPASCSLIDFEEIAVNTSCTCGKCEGRNSLKWTCLSSYPCYVITVTYSAQVQNEVPITGEGVVLGINTSTPCSIDLTKDCYIEPEMNRKLVEEDVVALQEQSPAISCVHNKDNPSQVHLSKNYRVIGMGTVVHCYFWPSMLFFFSLLWLSYIIFTTIRTLIHMRQYAIWRKQQPSTYVSPSASEELFYYYLDRGAHTERTTWFDKVTELLKKQIISREEEEELKKIECIKKIEQTQVLETESGNLWVRPQFRPHNPMARSSVLIQGILEKDAEGSIKKAELEASRMLSLEEQVTPGTVYNSSDTIPENLDE